MAYISLSTLDSETELATEIHNSLRKKEETLPKFQGKSCHLVFRRYLVDTLKYICEGLSIHDIAFNLAVYCLDIVMDKCEISSSQLTLVALVCLIIACTIEERGGKIPSQTTLNFMLQSSYLPQQFLNMELLLLKIMGWNVSLPTPAHFIDYYLSRSVVEKDLRRYQMSVTKEQAMSDVVKFTRYFINVALLDHRFLIYRPSVLAAACVAASRLCLQFDPPWTWELQSLSHYTFQCMDPCIHMMLQTYENDKCISIGFMSSVPPPGLLVLDGSTVAFSEIDTNNNNDTDKSLQNPEASPTL